MCNGPGCKGRIGVFEMIRVDDTIRRLINDGGDEALIARHAFLHSRPLGAAARALVGNGETTAEEAIRITRGDADEELGDGGVRLSLDRAAPGRTACRVSVD